jgi:hypothetical protein
MGVEVTNTGSNGRNINLVWSLALSKEVRHFSQSWLWVWAMGMGHGGKWDHTERGYGEWYHYDQ